MPALGEHVLRVRFQHGELADLFEVARHRGSRLHVRERVRLERFEEREELEVADRDGSQNAERRTDDPVVGVRQGGDRGTGEIDDRLVGVLEERLRRRIQQSITVQVNQLR